MKNKVLLILGVTLFISASLCSQEIDVKTSLKKYELIPALFFNYSKILGFGYGVAPMILYRASKNDTISPKSFSGLLLVYTSNESKSNTVELVVNTYKSVRQKKDVLAGRIRGEFGLGDVSFNQEVIIGRVDLRGYK